MIVKNMGAAGSEPLKDTAFEQVTETVKRIFSDSIVSKSYHRG